MGFRIDFFRLNPLLLTAMERSVLVLGGLALPEKSRAGEFEE